MKYSSFSRFMSLLIAMLFVVHSIPMQAISAFAEEIHKSEYFTGVEEISESSAENVQIVKEIVENRTAFTKEFQLDNGLHMITVYPEVVHYEADGDWKDIDNSLYLSKVGDTDSYVNKAGALEVAFPKQLTQDDAISITADGHTIRFFMSGELHMYAEAEQGGGRGNTGGRI